MNNGDSQDPEEDVRERIASRMRSIGQGPKTPITCDAFAELKSAASRLDQMLKAAKDADQQALRIAAVRLDRLLSDIRRGRDVSNHLKKRDKPETLENP